MVSSTTLTTIEMTVIALSRGDRASSLTRQNALCRLMLGQRPNLRLANPRLEALRRYAVLLRLHGSALCIAERERLCDAGFDDWQIGEIGRLVMLSLPEETSSSTSAFRRMRTCEPIFLQLPRRGVGLRFLLRLPHIPTPLAQQRSSAICSRPLLGRSLSIWNCWNWARRGCGSCQIVSGDVTTSVRQNVGPRCEDSHINC